MSVLEERVEELLGIGYDMLVADPKSPILAEFRGQFRDEMECWVAAASGAKVLFCVRPPWVLKGNKGQANGQANGR